ncbi:MAG: hypothetical protein ACFFBS_09550 [Promethearchaeota archaeon]
MSDEHNPYTVEGEAPTLRNSVVAFIDILGYQGIIRRAAGHKAEEELLSRLHSTLRELTHYLRDEDKEGKPYFEPLNGKHIFKIRTFTDNIVIGYPIQEDAESELGSIFMKLSLFQLGMVNRGFFIRGAISIGDLYIDDYVVFGNGLLDAYDAEQEQARDPRIVLTATAKASVNLHLEYYRDKAWAPQVREVYRDADGQYFLNYLDSILIAEDEHGPFYDELLRHKRSIEEKLNEFRDEPPYWSKYAWSANYHNFFCDQNRYFDNSHKIDLSAYQMTPGLIIEAKT